MDQGKKGSKNLHCHVCKIDFNSNADYALHEFSKKHCDNLIRLAKQKPIVSKQKAKIQPPKVEKEPPKINSVTHTGSFAKYGYFVPGEVYANAESSKEYNTDYDPYLQKFAENPFKEKPAPPAVTEQPTVCAVTSFSKKKKKKIKTCNVCNVTLLTVPEYEAHMKSLQHIWNLKVTGMGVTAHFVKATSDLHTTDVNEEPKASSETDEQIPVSAAAVTTTITEGSTSGPFPLLYCSDCELLLNSPQQYNAHIVGKQHIECAQRKAELKAKKEKLENPSPDQLYCYSCKISLNNLFQYNEHKNGKKHKTKCMNLIRKGITIPPEERVPGISLPNPKGPVVYPELYEKLVLDKQKERESKSEPGQSELNSRTYSFGGNTNAGPTYSLNYYPDNIIQYNSHFTDQKTETDSPEETVNVTNEDPVTQVTDCHSESPKIVFHKNQTALPVGQNCDNPVVEGISLQGDNQNQKDSDDCQNTKSDEVGVSRKQITILSDCTRVKCSICNESFQWQHLLDGHLGTEDHLKNILKQKAIGRSETDILNTLFSDRSVIKPNNLGKFTCSICSVTTDSRIEFDQHLNSIVHKYTWKDYKVKRTLEVKQIVGSNEENVYFCKLCRESWPSLLDYTQHLHFVKHKTMQRAQRAKTVLAKRRSLSLQKPKLSLKKRNTALKRIKPGKNTGVRTKVSISTNNDTQAPVSNQEPLEHKIFEMKNVSTGTSEKQNDKTTNDEVMESTVKKSEQVVRPNRKSFANRRGSPYHGKRPPLMSIPPLMGSAPFQPHFPRPRFGPARYWAPFSSPHPPIPRPYCEGPAMRNPYYTPSWNQRPPWSRFR